jgi:hypothetical protein
MSDNLLLTLLGTVGIGALVMSMNKEDEIRENWWGNIQLAAYDQPMQVVKGADGKTIVTDVSASNPQSVAAGLSTLASVAVKQSMASLSSAQSAAAAFGGNDNPNANNVQLTDTNEGFRYGNRYDNTYEPYQYDARYSPSLGSSQVTANDYVTYPNFEQSVMQPSPSLNLPAQIRYNPPSMNTMGITENFQCNKNNALDHANVVENYMSNDQSNPNPGSNYSSGNYNETIKKAAVNSPITLGSMEAGQGAPPENVMIYDRYMVVPGKSAGRFNRSNGVVDRIRGDLPICVDPCQKGWFASPGNPSQLTVGALNIIGGNTSQGNAVSNMVSLYGGQVSNLPSSGEANPQLNLLSKVSPSSGTTSVSAFA